MSRICFQMILLVVAIIINISSKNPITDKDYIHDINLDSNRRFFTADAFKTFLQKYDPVNVFDNIEKLEKARGRNLTVSERVDLVLQGIDPTDDLLKLKVQNGNPKVLALSNTRRYLNETWTAPPGLSYYNKDQFSLRPRMYELMKQAIYQARNKMVIMQIARRKHNHRPLYKMGFLLSKTDNACKVFYKVAFHAFRTCHRIINYAEKSVIRARLRFRMYELQVTHMRVLHLWFQVELLTELVLLNDIAFHDAYETGVPFNFTN